MQVEKSDTASATAAWKVMQTLGYVNERPFQETQNFLKKALEILKILEQSGINLEYWGGVLGMAATFDAHMRGGELPQDGPADGKPHAADNLELLRDFLKGETRWTFQEETTFNVTVDVNGTNGMETTQKGAEKEPPAGPEPMVKLGTGASFRLGNTHIHGQYETPEGVKAEAVERLQNLCRFCKEMESYRNGDSRDAGKQYGLIRGRAWGIDVVMLEFAISVLSELREIKEVRIPAQTDTPGVWELMRDILAGKRPAPEGTVFDVVIDMTGNPQAIKRREEPEPALRALAIAMPGGETVKLNSAAEAYRLAACIEEMAARVWPEAVPGK